MVAEPDSCGRRELHSFLDRAHHLGAHARRLDYARDRSPWRPVVCRGRHMQRSFCLGDVRCPRICAGYPRVTDCCWLPFGDLAAEPRVLRKGTCGSPDDRRRYQRGLRRRAATRDLTVTTNPPATDVPEGFVPPFRTSPFL